ncbi:MAG: serine hydrolase domain-containing protein [Bacillota bacterium]
MILLKALKLIRVNKTRYVICFLLLFLLFFNSSACTNNSSAAAYDEKAIAASLESNDPDIEKKVDELIKAQPEFYPFSGAILMAKDGRVLLSKGYGRVHNALPELNSPKTVYQISMITMYLTAAAIMQLQENGKLDLNDKVSKYLPDYPNSDKFTIHQLLNHVSGLPDAISGISAKNGYSKTVEGLIKLNTVDKLLFEPGENFNYTFINYYLLGCIIEKVSGMCYRDYMDKCIFKSLNMSSTEVFMFRSDKLTIARGHLQEGKFHDFVPQAYYNHHAANSIFSTVEDLYRLDRALYTEKLLKKASIDAMHTPYIKYDRSSNNDWVCFDEAEMLPFRSYGYGAALNEFNGYKAVVCEGVEAGFRAVMIRFIEEDSVIIILANNFETPLVRGNSIEKLTDIMFDE